MPACSPIVFDHCAGGLHCGYCLGKVSSPQKVERVTLYTASMSEGQWEPLVLATRVLTIRRASSMVLVVVLLTTCRLHGGQPVRPGLTAGEKPHPPCHTNTPQTHYTTLPGQPTDIY